MIDCSYDIVSMPLAKPFAITGHVKTTIESLRITLRIGDDAGIGEGLGVYYLGETPESMAAQIDEVRAELATGLDTDKIQTLLPPGGARNALDAALWDCRAKQSGKRVWDLLGVSVKPVRTVFTIGIDTIEGMAASAAEAKDFPVLKIKLSDKTPIERLEAIRAARPDATLVVDVNQGWDFGMLREYLPHVARLNVAMLEQPLPRGHDAELEGFESPVPLCGDESFQHSGEFEDAIRRYDLLNIKLDKCGGLTEAMRIVELARRHDTRLMVGNMCGNSYAMAPAFIVAQFCEFVDIDGPLLLADDVDGGLAFGEGGLVEPPTTTFWG